MKKWFMDSLLKFLSELSVKQRKQLEGIKFYLDDSTVKIGPNGNYVQGEYFDESRDIVFYTSLMLKSDFKRVFLHEVFYSFGITHNEMDKKYRGAE